MFEARLLQSSESESSAGVTGFRSDDLHCYPAMSGGGRCCADSTPSLQLKRGMSVGDGRVDGRGVNLH